MSPANDFFRKNILLDEDEFQEASRRFVALTEEMQSLQQTISSLLEELRKGFDTPAGRRFMNACERNLIYNLKDQADVIKHVSYNLRVARAEYASVFAEFEALNNTINSIGPN